LFLKITIVQDKEYRMGFGKESLRKEIALFDATMLTLMREHGFLDTGLITTE